MFIAGLFGTVAGDLIHHTMGLYTASAALCLARAGLILVRDIRAPASVLLYWSIIMAERCAGTAVGDALASRRAVALGVPMGTLFSRFGRSACLPVTHGVAFARSASEHSVVKRVTTRRCCGCL